MSHIPPTVEEGLRQQFKKLDVIKIDGRSGQKIWTTVGFPDYEIDAIMAAVKQAINPFDYVEPCKPDCSEWEHRIHQEQWDMAVRINEALGKEGHP